jgi:dipeptidyl aminopeptidase/acylaminoacyl peptidase
MILAAAVTLALAAPAPATGPLRVDDIFSLKEVGDPQVSPDGKWLAFLSGREGKKTQAWLLDRQGGEAVS